jgi:hypothetical protein
MNDSRRTVSRIVADARAELVTAADEALSINWADVAALCTPEIPGIPIPVADLFDTITNAVQELGAALQLLQRTTDQFDDDAVFPRS